MTPGLYQKFVPQFTTKPAVNQVECNPLFQQKAFRETMNTDDVGSNAGTLAGTWQQRTSGESCYYQTCCKV